MQAKAELSVITKTYDLLLWLVQKIDKFPRNRKFTLGDRLETTGLDLLSLLVRAKYSRAPCEALQEANLKVQQLRFLVRLAKDLRCLSIDSYEFAAGLLEALGSEVGGWLKSAGRGPQGVSV